MTPTPPQAAPASGAVRLALLAGCAFLLLCASVDAIWSGSGDFAHHYALVARIAQFWQLPPGVDPSLGEMNYYPRGGHILAAIIGTPLHSPLLGMHLTGLLSAFGVWAALAAILLTLPRRSAAAAAAILAALLIVNRFGLRLDLHGGEVVGNYFFSQLVAQSLSAAALLAALLMERRQLAPLLRHGFLIGAIYLLAGVHLLPPSQLLGFLLALIGLDLLLAARSAGAWRWRTAAPAAGAMLLAVLLLYSHPSFRAMKELSLNNGELHIRHFPGMGSIFAYCLLLLATSALLLARWIRLDQWGKSARFLAFKYFALYGMAVAGMCLTQLLALKMGHGSEYAVKKHMFTLNSLFLIQLALLAVGRFQARLRADAAPDARPAGALHAYLLLPLLASTAFLCLKPSNKLIDASDAVALEQQLTLRRDLVLTKTPGKYVYVLDFEGMPPMISYLMTIGVFGTPRTNNSMDVFMGQPLTESELVGTVLASPRSFYGKLDACRRPGNNDLIAILDGACVIQELHAEREVIGLASDDGPPNCVLQGFSGAEGGGRWTDQRQAALKCPVPHLGGVPARSAQLETTAFLNERVPAQRLSLALAGQPAVEYRYDAAQPSRQIALALPAGADWLEVRLTLPDAVSPKQIGLSGDSRQLGLLIKNIRFK